MPPPPSSPFQARRLLAPLTTAVLFGASYPPGLGPLEVGAGLPLLAGAGLAPLLVRWLCTRSVRWFLAESWLAWFGAGLIGFTWILSHPFWPTQLASVGALAVWAALFSGAWTFGLAVRVRLGCGPGVVALVCSHLAAEGLLSRGPWALPWGLVGHTASEASWLRPLATWTGTSGLSLWILLLALAVALIWTRFWTRSRARATPPISTKRPRLRPSGSVATTTGVLALASVLLGLSLVAPSSTDDASGALRLLLVQPNTDAVQWATLDDTTRVDRLRRLTDAALDRLRPPEQMPDLVLWPETALPPPSMRPARIDSLRRWVEQTGVPLLTGGIEPVPSSRSGLYWNRALLLRPHAAPRTYDKRHLVPFAEHVPGVEFLPVLSGLAVPSGGVRGYRRGDGPQSLSVGSAHVGPLICFESVIGPYARRYLTAAAPSESARRRPDAFVTLAQVGWWGESRAPHQFVAFSRLTATQTGRALAIATVSGPSVVVRSDGRVDAGAAIRTQADGDASGSTASVRLVTLPLHDDVPPFVRFGDVLFWFAVAGLVVTGSAFAVRRNTPSAS